MPFYKAYIKLSLTFCVDLVFGKTAGSDLIALFKSLPIQKGIDSNNVKSLT